MHQDKGIDAKKKSLQNEEQPHTYSPLPSVRPAEHRGWGQRRGRSERRENSAYPCRGQGGTLMEKILELLRAWWNEEERANTAPPEKEQQHETKRPHR